MYVYMHVSCSLFTHLSYGASLDRYDSRVKAMELDERPTEQYSDIGGLDKQIEEVCNVHVHIHVHGV